MRARIVVIGLLLAAVLLLASGVQAVSSGNYRLDWVVPLSGGGGAAASDGVALNATIGQSFIGGASASENHQAVLGFWGRVVQRLPVFLPAVSGKPE
jgi:hypothetical protein